jgi:RHS repeat-associated protein
MSSRSEGAPVAGNGTIWTWGANGNGQLGNGSQVSHTSPVQADTRVGMTALTAGDWHTLAISTTQTLTTNYTYDGLYRLLSGGTPGSPTSYTYDPVGNRLTKTLGPTSNSQSYTYDKADRIQSVGSTSDTVNADGNLTAAGSSSFSYDRANRLISATVSGATSTYAYDGDGKRASKTVGGTTTSYTWDTVGSLPNVLFDATLKYVYGLGLAYTMDGSSNIQVLHTDGLGSVRAITNSSGSVIQTFQTDEFGVPTLTQGTNTEPFRYAGQQFDPETGFYDLRARYYWPNLGRFLSRDQRVATSCDRNQPLTLNHFSYAENDPTSLADPSGMSSADTGGGDDSSRCVTIPVWNPWTGLSDIQICQTTARTVECTAHGYWREIATGIEMGPHEVSVQGRDPVRTCVVAEDLFRNNTPRGLKADHVQCDPRRVCKRV